MFFSLSSYKTSVDYQHTRLLMIDRQLARKKKNKKKGSRSLGPAGRATALCCVQRKGDILKSYPFRDAPPNRLSILCVVYALFLGVLPGCVKWH